MYKNLCVWLLPAAWLKDRETKLIDSINLAKSTGYDSVEICIETVTQLVREKSAGYVRSLFSEAQIIPGGWQVGNSFTNSWCGNEKEYRQLLETLPLWAKTAHSLNCKRAWLWIPNFSDERDYAENIQWHIKRIRPIAGILKDFNCRLGLEWQGTKTLRTGHKYEFIHDLKGLLPLCKEVGDNAGILLDSWHWYTSYGTLGEINSLEPGQVVYIHINDAPKGIHVDEQLDMVRAIPGETGVIDLVGFLKCLKAIGYNGPVEPSVPGSKILEKMSLDEAARKNCTALTKLFEAARIVEGTR